MKKTFVFLVIGILLFATGYAFAAGNTNIRLVINGQEVYPDVPAQIINGRTMVPVRVIAESLGATVNYDGFNRIVYITRVSVPVTQQPSSLQQPFVNNEALLQTQIDNIKALADSKRAKVEADYQAAKFNLDTQKSNDLLEASHDASARGITSSPLANYQRNKIIEYYDNLYGQLEEKRNNALAEIDNWERLQLSTLQ